jgi:hypothetical protein
MAVPVKAGLRPPPSAAGGLDRACHPAFVSHQAFDGKERLTPRQASCQLFSLRHLYADSDNARLLTARASPSVSTLPVWEAALLAEALGPSMAQEKAA